LTYGEKNHAAYLVLDSAYYPDDARCRMTSIAGREGDDMSIGVDCALAERADHIEAYLLSDIDRLRADSIVLIIDKTDIPDPSAVLGGLVSAQNFHVVIDTPTHALLDR
jgi:hypothetical protein